MNICSIMRIISIAFPLLATGTYGFPKDIGVDVVVSAFTEFLEEYEMEITLVVFGNDAVNVSGKLAYEVRSFVDDKYVKEALEADLKISTRSPLRSVCNN